MSKFSSDALWDQVVSEASKKVEALPQTRSDKPQEGPDPQALKLAEGWRNKSAQTVTLDPKPPEPEPAIKAGPEDETQIKETAQDAKGTETLPLIQLPNEATLTGTNGEVATPPTTVAQLELPPTKPTWEDFHLDRAERLSVESFPNPPEEGSRKVPATIPNVQHMLESYGIIARYNVIKKEPEFNVPGLISTVDNAATVAMAHNKSLARLNGISVSNIEEAILAVADRYKYNPVANWIMSKPWDGVDRLQPLYDTLTVREGFPGEVRNFLVYRWLISAAAAVLKPQGFKARGVLTLQGDQGIGKTSWFASLVSDAHLRDSVIKLDQRMDAGDKDCLLAAATHWIVELGELEGSFKKNIDRLKGFLTNDIDKVRVPYASRPLKN